MKIRTIWVDYGDKNREEFIPCIVLAVDEFLDDENPAYWDEQVAKLRNEGVLAYPYKEIELRVSLRDIERSFAPPTVSVEVP